MLTVPLKVGSEMPRFDEAAQWLHIEAGIQFNLDHHAIRSTLVYFWSMSCPSCKVNMPALQALRNRYKERGLSTIAIHMPMAPHDQDIEGVTAAVAELGITEPCAIDNEHIIGDRFEVKAWPTYYLFGADGKLKRHAAGGFGVRLMESALKAMFDDETAAATDAQKAA